MAKSIYKFHMNCGRMGEISGIFTATDEQVQEVLGKTWWESDILGKHSEIEINPTKKNLKKIKASKEIIDFFEKHELASGYDVVNAYEWRKEDGYFEDEG